MNNLSLKLDNLNLSLDTIEGVKINNPDVVEVVIREGLGLEGDFLRFDCKNEKETTTVLKVISLQYRMGKIEKNDQEKNEELKIQLTNALTNWKMSISHYKNKDATALDLKKMRKLLKYERFTTILLKNKAVRDACFKLIFTEHFPVSLLVQYFKICSIDLQNCLLSKQVGLFHLHGRKILRINETNLSKDLEFKINGQFVSILGEDAIQTNNGEKTWAEIRKIWDKSKKLPPEMAIFEDEGMVFYRPQGLEVMQNGEFVPIDTTVPGFWKDPNFPKFLTISKEKLEDMLDIKIPDDRPYVATIQGSYTGTRHVKDSHGASSIFMLQENGNYFWLPLGKYAKDFPQNAAEERDFLGNSVEAKFTYPDPTPFYTHRSHAIVRKFLTEDEATKLLMDYGSRMHEFQFAGNNCSEEFQRAWEEQFGKGENFFRMPLLDVAFPHPLNYIFGTIRWVEKWISTRLAFGLLDCVYWFFDSKREFSYTIKGGVKKTVSLATEKLAQQKQLAVPGILAERIEERTGTIKGVICFGGEVQFSNGTMV